MMQSLTTQKDKNDFSIRNGNYYQIRHKNTNKVLMMLECKDYTQRSPILGQADEHNINQVWMIEQIDDKGKGYFELVHANSTLILEDCAKCMKLTFGKWKKTQFFYVEKAPTENWNQYVFRDRPNSNHFLFADNNSNIKMDQKDIKSTDIIWVLKIAEKTGAIKRSVLIENAFTNQVIDVPEASQKKGKQLCQYHVNKRFNQRFELQRNENNTYSIMNVKSKLYLDIQNEKKKEGASIIQYPKNNKPNQSWFIENQGKGLYIIRSAMDRSLSIGIKNNSIDPCTILVTTKRQDFALWRILGEFNPIKIMYV